MVMEFEFLISIECLAEAVIQQWRAVEREDALAGLGAATGCRAWSASGGNAVAPGSVRAVPGAHRPWEAQKGRSPMMVARSILRGAGQ
ncbi:hypothetical protein CS8_019810 [Cupriavidus sp. 8B]